MFTQTMTGYKLNPGREASYQKLARHQLIMSGNVLVVAGAFLLAIQIGGGVSHAETPTPVDDLLALKEKANELIAKAYVKSSNNFNVVIKDCQNAYDWVTRNQSMTEQMQITVSDSEKNIKLLFEKLSESGEADGKPEEYFRCLIDNKEGTIYEIKKNQNEYVQFFLEYREEITAEMDKYMKVFERLPKVVEGVYHKQIKYIISCEDKICIDDAVGEAELFYRNVDIAVNSGWTIIIDTLLQFRATARQKLIESEETIRKRTERGCQNMEQC